MSESLKCARRQRERLGAVDSRQKQTCDRSALRVCSRDLAAHEAEEMACGGSGPANGRTVTRQQVQNMAVTAELYRVLLPEELHRANGLQRLVREPAATRGELSEGERETVTSAADRIQRVMAVTPGIGVEESVREFRSSGWVVSGENMEEEFADVERRTFSDDVHWGRVMAFLAFSVSFAAYVSSRGISGGAESVFVWTTRVLDGSLAEFIEREGGWVSLCVYNIHT